MANKLDTSYVQNRVRELANTKRVKLTPAPPPKDSGFGPRFLFVCILCVFFLTVAVMAVKGVDFSVLTLSSGVGVEVEETVTPPVVDQHSHPHNNLSGKVDGMEAKLEKMRGTLDTLRHRIWLLGVAVNENAFLSQRLDGQDYIVFDRQWRVNKVPETMRLNDDELNKIQGSMIGPTASMEEECEPSDEE